MSYIVRPKFLEGFEVEWVYSLGEQDPDDFNPDLVKYARRDFRTRAEAVAFIERILPELFDGEARLTAYHLESYDDGPDVWPLRAYFKEYDGETEFFTDEPNRA
jgi:hypothetical protein